jgi:hypothetical protein
MIAGASQHVGKLAAQEGEAGRIFAAWQWAFRRILDHA